jgi:hypothetical protein
MCSLVGCSAPGRARRPPCRANPSVRFDSTEGGVNGDANCEEAHHVLTPAELKAIGTIVDYRIKQNIAAEQAEIQAASKGRPAKAA